MMLTRLGHVAAVLLASAALLAAETAALPGQSLYRLPVPLQTDRSGAIKLDSLAGKPALLTMFYGDCKLACPVTLHSMQSIVAKVDAAQRGKMTALLISLDPKGDNAGKLAGLAKEHDMASSPWLFAVAGSDHDTRTLAAALGIRYRRLANGEINHSTRLLVTDRLGNVVASSEDMRPDGDPAIVEALTAQLR
jgi:protein SCO1/2